MGSEAHKCTSAAAAVTAEAVTYEQRVTGCILGAMCADALGASVEGWTPGRIASEYKQGLTTFQDTDRG